MSSEMQVGRIEFGPIVAGGAAALEPRYHVEHPVRIASCKVTHSDGCWRWHLDCAIAKVEALQAALRHIQDDGK